MHYYQPVGTAINRPLVAMDDDAIRRAAPSAFADSAHESRSARYAYIPTHKVIHAMRAEGFQCVGAMQSRSRLGRHEHTKHMLRFARPGDGGMIRVGDSIPQVALVNSHDGSSAYSLMAGLHRLVCSNGLLVAEGTVESVKVQHTGDIVGRVIEGSYTVIDGANRAAEVSQQWGAIQLSDSEAEAFANSAALLRWDGDKAPPVDTRALLRPRRAEDQSNDLWTVFNRTQESLVRGGQRGRQSNGRRFTVRPVAAIDGNVKLNRALWSLGEEMAKLKAAA